MGIEYQVPVDLSRDSERETDDSPIEKETLHETAIPLRLGHEEVRLHIQLAKTPGVNLNIRQFFKIRY
jgi:hypothetical protein